MYDLIPANETNAGTYLYVANSIDEGFIAQVIISRNQHMIGVECKARCAALIFFSTAVLALIFFFCAAALPDVCSWLDKFNSPGIVVPAQIRPWAVLDFDEDRVCFTRGYLF